MYETFSITYCIIYTDNSISSAYQSLRDQVLLDNTLPLQNILIDQKPQLDIERL